MIALEAVDGRARADHLVVLGGFRIDPDEASDLGLAPTTRSLLLLGPLEPGFWPHAKAQPEFDGQRDPLDRWSRRVVGKIARDLGGHAMFPFEGPPYFPFHRWALRSGRAWESPVRLLVHDTAGLLISYRAALAFDVEVALPAPQPSPCTTCADRPCLTACPVAALTGDGYDVPACHAYLSAPAGQDCMNAGCRVRRACPISQSYARLPEQSAYHMRQFHK